MDTTTEATIGAAIRWAGTQVDEARMRARRPPRREVTSRFQPATTLMAIVVPAATVWPAVSPPVRHECANHHEAVSAPRPIRSTPAGQPARSNVRNSSRNSSVGRNRADDPETQLPRLTVRWSIDRSGKVT